MFSTKARTVRTIIMTAVDRGTSAAATSPLHPPLPLHPACSRPRRCPAATGARGTGSHKMRVSAATVRPRGTATVKSWAATAATSVRAPFATAMRPTSSSFATMPVSLKVGKPPVQQGAHVRGALVPGGRSEHDGDEAQVVPHRGGGQAPAGLPGHPRLDAVHAPICAQHAVQVPQFHQLRGCPGGSGTARRRIRDRGSRAPSGRGGR